MLGQYLNACLNDDPSDGASKNMELFHCPSDRTPLANRVAYGNPGKLWVVKTPGVAIEVPISYGINGVVAGDIANICYPPRKVVQIKRKSDCFLFSEGKRDFKGTDLSEFAFNFHPHRITVVYVDGHAKAIQSDGISSTGIPSTSAFWIGGDN